VRFGTVAQDGRARAVAEEHAGVAVAPVDDGGKFFRADDQDGVVGAGHDELLADFQGENEARTGGLDVKGGRAIWRRFFPAPGRRWRERHVGRDGGQDDQVNLSGVTLARSMATRGGLAARSEVASCLAAMRRSLMPVRVRSIRRRYRPFFPGRRWSARVRGRRSRRRRWSRCGPGNRAGRAGF
jgi:hypothetical protein